MNNKKLIKQLCQKMLFKNSDLLFRSLLVTTNCHGKARIEEESDEAK
jgi:hypothetical protein